MIWVDSLDKNLIDKSGINLSISKYILCIVLQYVEKCRPCRKFTVSVRLAIEKREVAGNKLAPIVNVSLTI